MKNNTYSYILNKSSAPKSPYETHRSELQKLLTREIWEEYKDQVCEKGVPFKLGIFPDIRIRENEHGLIAGSSLYYTKFSKLYYQMI
jgi:hypothetical protein